MSFENLNFVSAMYIRSKAVLEQGYKGGTTPRGVYRGGNGTFLTFTKTEYWLKFKDNTTGKVIEKDCYKEIKEILKEAKMVNLTERRRQIIEEMLRKNELPLELLNLPIN